jgi:hypothetical protein
MTGEVASESVTAGRSTNWSHAVPFAHHPALQATPHEVPSHVAEPFAGAAHGVHELPHVAGLVFETHWLPHAWEPGLQATPHDVPLQVATPFAGTGHGVHEPPQVVTEAFVTHCEPHR